jgi:hypothetical protein
MCSAIEMLQLNPTEQEQLRRAILNAHPGYVGVGRLDRAFAAVGIDLARYGVPGTDFEQVLFSAILDQNAQGRIADVIGAARRANTGDPVLSKLEKLWLRTAAQSETASLEAMVIDKLNYHPADDWTQRLRKAFGWVCRVERQIDGAPLGTGFLVADDLVLTNYHVIFEKPGVSATAVQFRFDLSETDGSLAQSDATTVQPVQKSLPNHEEWGDSVDPGPGLDFALVRLSKPMAADHDPASTVRGHAYFDVNTSSISEERPILILEHPKGAPLQICMGSITGKDPSATRLRHNATTQCGSSGSPCLSMDLKVIALHNGALGNKYNTAVPIACIKESLLQCGLAIG